MLNDLEIIRRCSDPKQHAMISPFVREQRTHNDDGEPIISYGPSSYGYDIRVGDNFRIFTNVHQTLIDPKNFDPLSFIGIMSDSYITIPPNSFVLAHSLEYIRVPRDILVICIGKSTYARCGIVANVTPLEPEWEGQITIEISNTAPLPARIYANEGIIQLVFLKAEEVCDISYADRQGKYQGQRGVVLPRTSNPTT